MAQLALYDGPFADLGVSSGEGAPCWTSGGGGVGMGGLVQTQISEGKHTSVFADIEEEVGGRETAWLLSSIFSIFVGTDGF